MGKSEISSYLNDVATARITELNREVASLKQQLKIQNQALLDSTSALATDRSEHAETKLLVASLQKDTYSITAELENYKKENSASADRVKALEAELVKVTRQRDAEAKSKREASVHMKALEKERDERVKALEKERDERAEEAELTVLQSQQIQEEMERCFYQLRGKNDLLKRHEGQQRRTKKLLSTLIAKLSSN